MGLEIPASHVRLDRRPFPARSRLWSVLLFPTAAMASSVKRAPLLGSLLKRRGLGSAAAAPHQQQLLPTSSVSALQPKEEAPACPFHSPHALSALPGPTKWPLVGSLFDILRKGGLKKQHETLVSHPKAAIWGERGGGQWLERLPTAWHTEGPGPTPNGFRKRVLGNPGESLLDDPADQSQLLQER